MTNTSKALPDQAAGDDFVVRLRAALPPILDELLGLDPEPEPARRPAARPSSRRENEESFRQQVARAVQELADAAGAEKPAPPAGPATPPQPETKPWRQRFWGGD